MVNSSGCLSVPPIKVSVNVKGRDSKQAWMCQQRAITTRCASSNLLLNAGKLAQ